MKGNITITKKEYYDLRIAQEELERLNGMGVDNWQGYDECWDDWETTKKQIEDEIFKDEK